MINTLAGVIKRGGTLVSKEHGDARVEICKQCPEYGNVLFEGSKIKGCKICECPSITKPYMDTYFSALSLSMKKAECSDKKAKRWEQVDNRFFNIK